MTIMPQSPAHGDLGRTQVLPQIYDDAQVLLDKLALDAQHASEKHWRLSEAMREMRQAPNWDARRALIDDVKAICQEYGGPAYAELYGK